MSEILLGPSNGLSNSKLSQANAAASDVLSGKTFYAGDKTLKTGSMVNRGIEQIGGGFAWDNDYVYIQPIPAGYYYNDNPVNSAWNPRVKVQKQKMFDLLGGNHSGWGATINPGESVAIPAGYHNGTGRVYANPATYNGYSMVELRAESSGNEYVSGNSTAYASGTIKWCPTGRVAYSPDDSSVYIEVTGYSGNAINYRWSAHNFGIRFNLVVIV